MIKINILIAWSFCLLIGCIKNPNMGTYLPIDLDWDKIIDVELSNRKDTGFLAISKNGFINNFVVEKDIVYFNVFSKYKDLKDFYFIIFDDDSLFSYSFRDSFSTLNYVFPKYKTMRIYSKDSILLCTKNIGLERGYPSSAEKKDYFLLYRLSDSTKYTTENNAMVGQSAYFDFSIDKLRPNEFIGLNPKVVVTLPASIVFLGCTPITTINIPLRTYTFNNPFNTRFSINFRYNKIDLDSIKIEVSAKGVSQVFFIRSIAL